MTCNAFPDLVTHFLTFWRTHWPPLDLVTLIYDTLLSRRSLNLVTLIPATSSRSSRWRGSSPNTRTSWNCPINSARSLRLSDLKSMTSSAASATNMTSCGSRQVHLVLLTACVAYQWLWLSNKYLYNPSIHLLRNQSTRDHKTQEKHIIKLKEKRREKNHKSIKTTSHTYIG